MREILFRGKRINNGEWVYGSLGQATIEPVGKEAYVNPIISPEVKIPHGGGHWDVVDPSTVGQCTGLTDKNGKKIFEGDICRMCLDPEICVGVVEYDERISSFIVKVGETEMLTFIDYFIARNSVGDKVWIEVIGNIHDNPELLEETE